MARVRESVRKDRRTGDELKKKWIRGLGALVDSSSDAFLLFDKHLNLLNTNPAGGRLVGLSSRFVKGHHGQNILDIMPYLRGTEVYDGFVRTLESGRPFAAKSVAVPANKKNACLNIEARKIGDCLGVVASDISESMRMLHTLTESENRLRLYLESSPDAIYINDAKGRFLYGNKAAERVVGYPRQDLVGKNFMDLGILPPEYLPKAAKLLKSNLKGQPTGPDEFELVRKDGGRVSVEICTYPVARAGEIEVIGIARDITERKQAQEQIRIKEDYYRALIEDALEAMVIVNSDGTIRSKSRSIEQVLGYGPEDDLGESSFSFVHPDDVQNAADTFARLVSCPGLTLRQEIRARHADGSWHLLEVVGKNLLENAAVQGIVANFRDITEQKMAVRELRESEKRFRNVLDNSLDMIYRMDLATGRYDYLSPASRQLLGYDPEEFIALGPEHAVSLIHPEDRDRVSESIIGLMAPPDDSNPNSTIEYRIRHRTLGYRWMADSISVIHNDAREPIAVVGNLRDATELKSMQKTLQQSEEHFRALIENSLEAIAIVNAKGLLTYESPSFERLLGYASEDHVGTNPFEHVHEDDVPRVSKTFTNLARNPGAITREELRVWHKDGSLRFVEVVGQNLLEDPAVGGIVTNIRDITDRKRAEQELKQLYEQERTLRQQLEREITRRVEFTRALAHELKTPLTSMMASSDLLASELRDEPFLSMARNLSRSSANLNTRIDELLDLARGEIGMLQLKLEAVDLSPVLRDTAESMTALALKRGQVLVIDVPLSLAPAQADIDRVQQIVVNLLNNAMKFTPPGGKITLRAREKEAELVVEIQDTGYGISRVDRKRLFEPYHRLDNDRQHLSGLGLGLALSKTLIELHGGRIWVRSRVGRGSTFGFSLPIEVPQRPAAGAEPKLWRILLVEDSQEIVDAVSLTFQILWPEAEVVSTGLGEEGIALVESEEPDVVILDLGLPDISGLDVLRQVRLFSAVPIVILTVKADEADMLEAFELGADDYLVKPFKQSELVARLKVQLRKISPPDQEAPIVVGALRLDPTSFQLDCGGKEISLTAVEGRIMEHLMRNAGRVVSHTRLAEAVWGEDYLGALDSLRVYIRYLRRKVEADSSNPRLILTKPGVGYLLAKPARARR